MGSVAFETAINVQLDVLDDVAEDVANGRAEQSKNDDYDDGDEHQNQCIFHEALAFFTRGE